MKNNIKILAGALITAMAATSIWVSFADDSTNNSQKINKRIWKIELTAEQKNQMEEIKAILDKKRAWTTLTTDEQTKLTNFESTMPKKKFWGAKGETKITVGKWIIGNMEHGPMMFWADLTTEEQTALSKMTEEQTIAFFEAKSKEMQAKMESHEKVIDKLLAWEKLTSSEETIRAEIIKLRAERKTMWFWKVESFWKVEFFTTNPELK